MPILNQIEPVLVSRGLREGVCDSLEQRAGHTLSNIILQLSNISARSGQLIESLLEEITNLNKKYYKVKDKIVTLNSRIEHLDSETQLSTDTPIEPVIKPRKKHPQYEPVLSRYKLPPPLAEQYNRCDTPPPFQSLFGDITSTQENRNRFKFYSNTEYFKQSLDEKKKLDKIKRRIQKNKLLKLQTAEIVDAFEKDDKFYPVPVHPVMPQRSAARKLVRTPAVTELDLQVEEQSMSQSDAETVSQYSYYVAPSFATNTTDVYYADTVMTSVYSVQDSFQDNASVVYEIFESAEVASLNSSCQLDKISLGESARLTGPSSLDRTMDDSIHSSLSKTDSREEDNAIGRRILPLRECRVIMKRELSAKTLLKSFVQERRKYIQTESTGTSSDYSEESSESESSGSDGED